MADFISMLVQPGGASLFQSRVKDMPVARVTDHFKTSQSVAFTLRKSKSTQI